ncbi:MULTISPECIES: hypothetical protein [unclassified Frankia]|uniref:hypothetical protein n=1 Tax=unclassified Frankia TaxID=2632575 RepID=UPI002AD3506A|nr:MULTISPECIES: hypothetical protein [unclassified Frankia]
MVASSWLSLVFSAVRLLIRWRRARTTCSWKPADILWLAGDNTYPYTRVGIDLLPQG